MSATDTSLWSLIHQLSCSDALSMHDSSSVDFLISADLEVIDDFITGQSRTAMTRVMFRHS